MVRATLHLPESEQVKLTIVEVGDRVTDTKNPRIRLYSPALLCV